MMKYIVAIIVLALIAGGGYYWWMQNQGTRENTDSATTTPLQATPGQVQAEDRTAGTGREALPGTQVTVEYVGQLQDGTVFDSSQAQGQPLVFLLGAEGIIPGFQIGVNGMKEGGERAILIPPDLAYGDQMVGSIPPNSPLLFLLKLVKVEDAPAGAVSEAGTEAE